MPEPAGTVPAPSAILVKVGGRDVALDRRDAKPDEVRVYPFDRDSVLVAYAGRDVQGPHGGRTLWRVPCQKGAPEPFAQLDAADFGHSVLSADRRTLFFTGPYGIHALNLETKRVKRLTEAPALERCDTKNAARESDVVQRWVDSRTLGFERGAGCGFEGEWESKEMLLRNPGTVGMAVEPAPRPPFPSVAVAADGGIWLSDGLCEDPATFGRVLYSQDRGDHWRKVRVKMLEEQPVRHLIADRAKAGSMLLFTFACGSSAHTPLAWVYITADEGKTFRPIAAPPGIPTIDGRPNSELDPIRGVVTPDGNLEHLIVYGYSDKSPVAVGDVRWESRDGGAKWGPPTPATAPAGVGAAPAVFGEWQYAIRKDGLYRSHRQEPAVRIYPRP